MIFFFFYIYLLKLPRHCDLLRRQQFLNCLSIYCCSFSASTQFSGQDEKVKRVFNMSLHRISVTELLTLILLPSVENCFPVVTL